MGRGEVDYGEDRKRSMGKDMRGSLKGVNWKGPHKGYRVSASFAATRPYCARVVFFISPSKFFFCF